MNVATWLAARHPERVLAVDLDVEFGQVATHLNLKPRHTLAELARDDQALREPELLRSYAEQPRDRPPRPRRAILAGARAGSSPRSRPTSSSPRLGRPTTRSSWTRARSSTSERWPSSSGPRRVVLPIVPEIGALKALHSLLEYLTEVGSVRAKSTFVLNHIFAREMLTMKQIEGSIAARVEVELPYDPGLYLKAVNEGIPLVRGAARSAAAERLARLAVIVTGEELASGNGEREERRSGLFGGRTRRS